MNWLHRLLDRWRKPAHTAPSTPEWVDVPAATGADRSVEARPGPRVGFAARTAAASPVGLARERLASAFHPSTPTRDPSAFAGREGALATLIQALEVQKLHVVVYGDRGLGKTSLLHIMSHLARESGYLVSYATCGSDSGFDTVFRQVAASVPLRHHRSADPGTVGPADSLADRLGEAPLDVPRAAELFGGLQGSRLLIVLDEFDRAQSEQFRLQVAELVKALSDTAATVQLVIAGVASNLNALIRHIPSIRRNLIGLPLTPMTDPEVRDLLRLGAERSGLVFDPAAEDALVAGSNGSPYLANLLGQLAGLCATDEDRTAVTPSDVRVAIDRGADELSLRLTAATLKRIGALDQPELRDLVAAAGGAMRDVGRIDGSDLRDPERFGPLVEPMEGEEATWCFTEESAVPFLWLLGLSHAPADPVRP